MERAIGVFNANFWPVGNLFSNNHERGLKIPGDKKAFFRILPPFFSSNGEIDLQTMLQFSWDLATEVTISTGPRRKARKEENRNSHLPSLRISNRILWGNWILKTIGDQVIHVPSTTNEVSQKTNQTTNKQKYPSYSEISPLLHLGVLLNIQQSF